MRKSIVALVLCAAWIAATPAAEQKTDTQRQVERAGTALKYAIPAAAVLATFLIDSSTESPSTAAGVNLLSMGGTPRHDLLLAMGRSWAATTALKYSVHETRPDGGSHSFPSGHASMAFGGAEFIRKEYGWQWAAPAYLAAGFVGWSRVKADRHYTGDVLAGAAIGILANHDFWEGRTRAGQLRLTSAMLVSGRSPAPGLRIQLQR